MLLLASLLGLLACLHLGADDSANAQRTEQTYQQEIAPFLKRNCLLCHQAKNATAGLDLSKFASAELAWRHPEVWEKVSARLLDGTMPPKGLPRPPMEQRDAVVSWIREGLETLARNAKPDPGRVTARRLNRVEYNNTVRDLLGVDFQPAANFPADDAGYGFDNIGDVLTVSPVLMEKYVDAAWEIAQRAIVSPQDRMEPTYARLSGESLRRLGNAASQATGALAFPHAREASFEFPADAEYEITLRVADRRRQRQQPGLIAMAVVGVSQPQVFETQLPSGGEDSPNEFAIRVRVTAGTHTLRAATVDGDMQPVVVRDEADSSRFIDVGHFEVRGPFGDARRAITRSHQQIFVCNPRAKSAQAGCAQRILTRLTRLAYRRPISAADTKPLLALAAAARAEGFPFEEQIRFALQGILVSPHFLFRVERGQPPEDLALREQGVRQLTPVELASRLSTSCGAACPMRPC
jgi:mono/diheme cytochrome c family protein